MGLNRKGRQKGNVGSALCPLGGREAGRRQKAAGSRQQAASLPLPLPFAESFLVFPVLFSFLKGREDGRCRGAGEMQWALQAAEGGETARQKVSEW